MNNVQKVLGKPVDANDAAIGSVYDLYFDEHTWDVRYVVVDTGKWLPGQRCSLSPARSKRPGTTKTCSP